MNIFEKIFGNLKLVFKFLNRDNSPSNKSSISNSSGNIVQQAARDFNIGVGHSEKFCTSYIVNIEQAAN